MDIHPSSHNSIRYINRNPKPKPNLNHKPYNTNHSPIVIK